METDKPQKSMKYQQAQRLVSELYPEYEKSAHRLNLKDCQKLLASRDYFWSKSRGAWVYQRPLPGFERV